MGAGQGVLQALEGVQIHIPDWQRNNEVERQHAHANEFTRRELIEKLLHIEEDAAVSDFLAAGFLNEDMKEAIFYIIGGRSAEALEEEDDEYFETHVDSISKRRLAIELIIGTTIRNRNEKIAVFFNVVLSLLA